jgi:hypothetical protein
VGELLHAGYVAAGVMWGWNLWDHEWAALATLLSGSDIRLRKLRLQWECCTCFKRDWHNGFTRTEIGMVLQFGCLLHPALIKTIQSAEYSIAVGTGRIRTYSLTIGPGGGNCCLIVSTREGILPDRSPSESQGESASHFLQLPPMANQVMARERMALAMPEVELAASRYGLLEYQEPISETTLASCEESLGARLPNIYRRFVKTTNGMQCGDSTLFDLNRAIQMAGNFKEFLRDRRSIIIADDVINGFGDGLWYLPLEGNERCEVVHIGSDGPNTIDFIGFVNNLMRRVRDQEVQINTLAEKRKRRLTPELQPI